MPEWDRGYRLTEDAKQADVFIFRKENGYWAATCAGTPGTPFTYLHIPPEEVKRFLRESPDKVAVFLERKLRIVAISAATACMTK